MDASKPCDDQDLAAVTVLIRALRLILAGIYTRGVNAGACLGYDANGMVDEMVEAGINQLILQQQALERKETP